LTQCSLWAPETCLAALAMYMYIHFQISSYAWAYTLCQMYGLFLLHKHRLVLFLVSNQLQESLRTCKWHRAAVVNKLILIIILLLLAAGFFGACFLFKGGFLLLISVCIVLASSCLSTVLLSLRTPTLSSFLFSRDGNEYQNDIRIFVLRYSNIFEYSFFTLVSLGILVISRQAHLSYMKNIDKMHVTGLTLCCSV